MKTQEEKNEEHGKECAALVVKIQNGDKDAEAELYIKCKPMLFNYAKNLCKNTPDAKDTLSNAWEKGMIRIRKLKYKEGNRFPGFICTLMHNDFLDDPRKKVKFVNLDFIAEIANTIREECYSKGMRALLHKLLLKHTARMQDIIQMVFVQDIPFKIVGRKYNIKANTLRSEVSKIKNALKAKLKLFKGDMFVEMDSGL